MTAQNPCTNPYENSAHEPGLVSLCDANESWGERFWSFRYPMCQTIEECLQKMHILMASSTENGCDP